MKCFFSFLLLFLCYLRMEALEYPMVPGVTLNDHTPSICISTELLDTFVEKALSSFCMIGNGEATHLSDRLKQGWYNGKGGGTGFFITHEGHLITNKHVIESMSNPIAFLGLTGHCVKTSIVAVHPTKDLAILKIDKPHHINLSYLRMSFIPEEIGNWVFSLRGRGIVDHSRLFALPSMGKVIGYVENNSFDAYTVLSIGISEGNSGSPLLNLEGKVIGIITRKAAQDGLIGDVGASLALSIHEVKDWIEETLRSDGYFETLE